MLEIKSSCDEYPKRHPRLNQKTLLRMEEEAIVLPICKKGWKAVWVVGIKKFLAANVGNSWDKVYSDYRHRMGGNYHICYINRMVDHTPWYGFYLDDDNILREKPYKKYQYKKSNVKYNYHKPSFDAYQKAIANIRKFSTRTRLMSDEKLIQTAAEIIVEKFKDTVWDPSFTVPYEKRTAHEKYLQEYNRHKSQLMYLKFKLDQILITDTIAEPNWSKKLDMLQKRETLMEEIKKETKKLSAAYKLCCF